MTFVCVKSESLLHNERLLHAIAHETSHSHLFSAFVVLELTERRSQQFCVLTLTRHVWAFMDPR